MAITRIDYTWIGFYHRTRPLCNHHGITLKNERCVVKRLNRRAFLRTPLGIIVAAHHKPLLSFAATRFRHVGVASATATAALEAHGTTDTTVKAIWMAVESAEQYVIYRDGSVVAKQPGTLFMEAGLAAGTTYRYQVAALIAGVEQERSAEVVVKTQAPRDTSFPTQPGSISVSQLTSSEARLSWAVSRTICGLLATAFYVASRGTQSRRWCRS